MFERVLAGVDGSKLSENILPYVEAIAERFGSRVTLIFPTTAPERMIGAVASTEPVAFVDVAPFLDDEWSDAATYLQGIASRFEKKGLNCDCERPAGSATDVILDEALRINADLIVLSAPKHDGLSSLVFGDIAESVLRSGRCPVLLVPEPDERLA